MHYAHLIHYNLINHYYSFIDRIVFNRKYLKYCFQRKKLGREVKRNFSQFFYDNFELKLINLLYQEATRINLTFVFVYSAPINIEMLFLDRITRISECITRNMIENKFDIKQYL